jgi:radical SAM protein with 4Fe4S-binding SPASM domain
MDYGKQILRASPWDNWCKTKNRILTRIQYRILNLFGILTRVPPLDRFFSKFTRWFIGSYLYSIKLEVNTACTLKCKMCYIVKGDLEIPFDSIVSLLNQIHSCGVRLEILGGEPLLRKDISEIVKYAKQVAHVPFVSLYTNGIAATQELSHQLHRAGLDAVIVTLISHRKQVHDSFTGQDGSWERMIQGIKNLKSEGIPVYAFTAVHRDNYLDIDVIDDFVKHELGVHALFYQYIPQVKNDPLMITPEVWHRIKHRVLMEVNRKHMEFIRKFFMLTGNSCSGGNFVLTIKANGSVQPCPFISDLSLGSIYRSDIWSIYRNRYRDTYLQQFKQTPEDCLTCSFNSVCGGGCKAGNPILVGDYSHKDHRCLGPYHKPLIMDRVIDCVPTFF